MSIPRLLLCLTLVLTASHPTFAQSKDAQPAKPAPGYFPVCGQLSPLPSGKGWKSGSGPLDEQTLRDTIDNLREHGFSGVEMNIDLPPENADYLRKYALEQGMFLVTHTGGIEGFGRDKPPSPSVF